MCFGLILDNSVRTVWWLAVTTLVETLLFSEEFKCSVTQDKKREFIRVQADWGFKRHNRIATCYRKLRLVKNVIEWVIFSKGQIWCGEHGEKKGSAISSCSCLSHWLIPVISFRTAISKTSNFWPISSVIVHVSALYSNTDSISVLHNLVLVINPMSLNLQITVRYKLATAIEALRTSKAKQNKRHPCTVTVPQYKII